MLLRFDGSLEQLNNSINLHVLKSEFISLQILENSTNLSLLGNIFFHSLINLKEPLLSNQVRDIIINQKFKKTPNEHAETPDLKFLKPSQLILIASVASIINYLNTFTDREVISFRANFISQFALAMCKKTSLKQTNAEKYRIVRDWVTVLLDIEPVEIVKHYLSCFSPKYHTLLSNSHKHMKDPIISVPEKTAKMYLV